MLMAALLLTGRSDSLADEGIKFFEKRIRPVLVRECYECHSTGAAEVKGGLRLDSRDGSRKGGDSGAAVVPGDVGASLLLDAIRHETLEMPPEKKLAGTTIADFTRWIEMGAPDPRDRPPTAVEAAELSWNLQFQARRRWWSLQPVRATEVPAVEYNSWSDHPVDAFILARLQQAGLTPAAPAEPHTLIRRISLVLTGLPPSSAEVSAFEEEAARDRISACRNLTNHLLKSPHFGERWARHWMDVVRFSETHGNEWNYEVHHAWRYRDYLIRALNQDVPYDQLVREHIAGDLLPDPRWNHAENFNESVIGTAFFRFGEVAHDDCIGLKSLGYDIVDNQLDTLTKAFQAVTVACARCHDHKIDAVSMRDYYALLGILRSSRMVAHTIDGPDVNRDTFQRLRELKIQIRAEISSAWRVQVADVARYLLAASAARRELPESAELAGRLDDARLEKWVAALQTFPQKDPPHEHPLTPWMAVSDAQDVSGTWQELHEQYERERQERTTFNRENFETMKGGSAGFDTWHATGLGLRRGATPAGEFIIAASGDTVVQGVVPAGCYTHTLSERMNGALRSPIVRGGKKRISFHVMGDHTSAVRLVSNNCQLNYANYRALTSDSFDWVTFEIPQDVESLRVYAELMTKFNNPKFPDQLGTLGGDTQNDRIPWHKAAADSRGYFGITRVVLHDCKETPRADVSPVCRLFEVDRASEKTTRADIAQCYAIVIGDVVNAWGNGQATDADVRWLNWLAQHQLLDHSPQLSPRLAELVADYRRVERQLAEPRIVPGLGDFDDGFEQPLLERGDFSRPGVPVSRRFLEVLGSTGLTAGPVWYDQGSGRRALAEQIACPHNPLTTRVMANRIWHHLFGTGIVRTVDDFGKVGDLPTHPQLLNHLATQFVEQDWSIKALVRHIVLSQTFQQSSLTSRSASEADPANRLLHSYPARRMEAESIRDALLATSGRLDRTLYGWSVHPFREQSNDDRRLFAGPLDGDGRRSIYIKANLMESPRFLRAFNTPGGKVTQGRRDKTNVPAQALALLNDELVLQLSEVWADRNLQQREDTVAIRLQRMYFRAMGRRATVSEFADFEAIVAHLAELHEVTPNRILTDRGIWKDIAHVIFNLKEFIYIP